VAHGSAVPEAALFLPGTGQNRHTQGRARRGPTARLHA
jgi:hypothetical protein